MIEQRLFPVSCDITTKTSASTQWDLSMDDGSSWRPLSVLEQHGGLQLVPPKSLMLRARQRGAWGISQRLRFAPDERTLVCEGPQDFGTLALDSSMVPEVGTEQVRHSLSVCMSLLRDALPDRTEHGNTPPPPYMYSVMAFNGPSVLAADGAGLQRFAAGRAVNVLSYGETIGELLFVKTPSDAGKPQLCAVFVPNGLDLGAPVPIHLFYSPSTGNKKLPYPYSDGDDSFNAMVHNYLVGGGKRFLSQHVASGKACVFVFPIPSPQSYFTNLQSAASARLLCLEIVYYLRKSRGGASGDLPTLGVCALSGFSEGGRPLAAVLGSSPSGSAFPELEEVYLLDAMPPSGNSADTGSYHRLMGLLNGWWASGKGKRKVRFYSQFYGFGVPLAVRGSLVRSNGSAVEYQGNGSTCFFAPKRFWATVEQEQAGLDTNPGYVLDNVHQLMPCVFLEHALMNSGFPER